MKSSGAAMKFRQILILSVVASAIVAGAGHSTAQAPNQLPAVPAAPQAGSKTVPPHAPQGGDESTLEITPQPGAIPYRPNSADIPSGSAHQPGQSDTSTDSRYRSNLQDGTGINGEGTQPHRRPYLGIT
ncbi:MAG TPA: hypothetical protein VMT58_01590, partial [Candidatus Binataceae bacterium]|nr:hypothetical protein [Candidatus Binataceae bacterium]